MASCNIDVELEALAGIDLDAVRYRWRKRFNTAPPKVSAGLLRLALAYDVQSSVMGGISSASEALLRTYAAAHQTGAKAVRLRTAQPGMRLVRAWNGNAHVATVNEAGEIEWQGRTWRSLSEVARAITGTHWSGPKFFGLRNKSVAA